MYIFYNLYFNFHLFRTLAIVSYFTFGQPQKELFLHIVNFIGFDNHHMPIFLQSTVTLVTSIEMFLIYV